MTYRRQRYQKIFGFFLLLLAAVNVLFLFILNRPAMADYANLQESMKEARAKSGQNRQYYASLERTSTDLDRFERDKNALLMMHLLKRNVGYSEIVTRLDNLVQKTGVKKTRVTYTLNTTSQPGLYSVSMTMPLEGNYSNVVNFIQEIEQSDTFLLITAVDLQAATQPAAVRQAAFQGAVPQNTLPAAGPANASGAVALSLAMETYFYQ